jgi:preprotein translocase subunit SecE
MTSPANVKKSKMGAYFRGVKAEMKKVSWPTKKELLNYTSVVVAISVLVAVIVWILDIIINGGLGFIIK